MNNQEQWTSKIGFILAAAGSAIGLGAIWKFPYVAGTSGGGAFFFIFLLFTFIVGLPLLLAEFAIGRSTQKEAITAYKIIVPASRWHWIGRLGVITCFILLSFYSVIGGWIILYLITNLTGQLLQVESGYSAYFEHIIANPYLVVGSQLLFIVVVIIVVAKGVQAGIEKANKYMMPALFILFLVLIVRSLTLEGAMEGVEFFLKPNFSNITSEAILYAMGQSFFSLSIGVSVMVTYSSYLSKKESLPNSAFSIVGLNVFIALLAGLAIFPATFSLGIEPAEGPGLLFVVLPAVFEQISLGGVFLSLFLGLFLFATLTSAFSMLEIIVASIIKDERQRRVKITWIVGFLILLFGIPSALSFGVLSEYTLFDKILFDQADYLVSNILMPLGVFLISIFVPLKMKKDVLKREIGGSIWFSVWFFLLKYVIPVVIIAVFLDVIGVY
ncbi:sodium-dependent transporter [Metabacillus arenae]|uniref:Transporter n=1 Tax=Metabacillus arenae TaxID=2771434 RepID=A0A926NDQ7_9BACI|nr:sodium-dependent transporter [Metabacillus arenae]MBD1378960.1 sodium-dependent transporter [Metabacillus arenae]